MQLGGDLYLAHVASDDEISDDVGDPVYRQLAAIIRRKIESGQFSGRLPSVRTLTETYGVGHVTATNALTVLKDEGLVYPVQGRGWFVKRS
jgi:DNA-binding GntR family transcriptional regulator